MTRYLYVKGSDPWELEQAVNKLAAEAFEPVGPVSFIPVAYYYRDEMSRHPEQVKAQPLQPGEPGGILLQLMRKGV